LTSVITQVIAKRNRRALPVTVNNLNVQRLNDQMGHVLHLVMKFLNIKTIFFLVVSQINQNISDPINDPAPNIFW